MDIGTRLALLEQRVADLAEDHKWLYRLIFTSMVTLVTLLLMAIVGVVVAA